MSIFYEGKDGSLNELTHAKYIGKKMVKGKWKYIYKKPPQPVKKDFKYIKREKVNGKWEYIYKLPEKKLADNKLQTKTQVGKLDPKSILNKFKIKKDDSKSVDKQPSEIAKSIDKKVSDTKKAIDKRVSDSIKTVNDTVVRDAKQNIKETEVEKLSGKEYLNAIKKDKVFTNDEDMNAVNPKYDPSDYTDGYETNCGVCTITYELRRRGYDVEAEANTYGLGLAEQAEVFKGLEKFETLTDGIYYTKDSEYTFDYHVENRNDDTAYLKTYDTPEKYEKALSTKIKKYGEGSRGNLNMYWERGGGHSIAWEVNKGKVTFRDCQVNKVIDIKDYYEYMGDYNKYTQIFRTDDKQINIDSVKKYTKPRV